jgi:hypothetical protein
MDILSLKNSRFGDYLHHIYPHELEVKDTTDTQKSAFRNGQSDRDEDRKMFVLIVST